MVQDEGAAPSTTGCKPVVILFHQSCEMVPDAGFPPARLSATASKAVMSGCSINRANGAEVECCPRVCRLSTGCSTVELHRRCARWVMLPDLALI